MLEDAQGQIDISSYVQSNEWKLLSSPVRRNIINYTCCPEPYIDLTFYVTIKRIPIFYTFSLIIPSVLLSLLTLVSYWLPPESPAKILLGMNLFLAFFLLLKLLSTSTPASSSIPLIGAYFCLNMVLITLSSFISVSVINLYRREDKKNKMPGWLRKLGIDGFSRMTCMEQRKEVVKHMKKVKRDHVTHHVTHVIDGTSDKRKSHHEKIIKSPVLPYNKWEPPSPVATPANTALAVYSDMDQIQNQPAYSNLQECGNEILSGTYGPNEIFNSPRPTNKSNQITGNYQIMHCNPSFQYMSAYNQNKNLNSSQFNQVISNDMYYAQQNPFNRTIPILPIDSESQNQTYLLDKTKEDLHHLPDPQLPQQNFFPTPNQMKMAIISNNKFQNQSQFSNLFNQQMMNSREISIIQNNETMASHFCSNNNQLATFQKRNIYASSTNPRAGSGFQGHQLLMHQKQMQNFPTALETEIKEVKKVLKGFLTKLQNRDVKQKYAMEWRVVALSIDRVFFALYIITIAVSLITIALMCFIYGETAEYLM